MTFQEWLNKALAEQGISKRELATRVGVDVRTVQTILGHTSVKTTAIYTHVMPELTADAMKRLDGLLRGNGAR